MLIVLEGGKSQSIRHQNDQVIPQKKEIKTNPEIIAFLAEHFPLIDEYFSQKTLGYCEQFQDEINAIVQSEATASTSTQHQAEDYYYQAHIQAMQDNPQYRSLVLSDFVSYEPLLRKKKAIS